MSSEIMRNQNGTEKLRSKSKDTPINQLRSDITSSPSYKGIYTDISVETYVNPVSESVSDVDHQSMTPSLPTSSSSLDSLIYRVPKSNECKAESQPIASLGVDSLIPEAAKLILSQTPKNRSDLVEQLRNDRSSPDFSNFVATDTTEIPQSLEEDQNFNKDDFPDEDSGIDYGLQVILEETASQMASDSDQELDRNDDYHQDTFHHPKVESKAPLPFDLVRDYTSSWLSQSESSNSLYEDLQNTAATNRKPVDEDIIIKHIRVPSDWDPSVLLKRIYSLPIPKSKTSDGNRSASSNDSMEGHMQILSGNRRKGTFWNAWKRKFCVTTAGKLLCYDNSDCQAIFQTINLVGGKVDFLDPVEFVGPEKGKTMTNKILGVEDGAGHYYVFLCGSTGEASRWIEVLLQQITVPKTFAIPISPTSGLSVFRDILVMDFGATNIRAGILTHQPTLPAIFFNSVMSISEETGRVIYGNDVYLPANRKKAKIMFPFECTSKMCQNNLDLKALKGFILKILADLKILAINYRLILTLPRMIDKRCRQSILQVLFREFEFRSVLMCHQSVISFWAHSAENGIVVDIGERCDVVPVSQGFVLSHAWGRAPFGGHVLKHSLRQGLGPQENGLYLSTPVENLVLRFISENFVCVMNGNGTGTRRSSQDSQEVVVEMDLRDVLPFSSLIGINQEILRGVSEGFFDPGLYGLDCESLQKILHKSLQDCGVDIRKEMSKNIFLVGGCTLIPGFPERLESELTKICPPHLKPTIQVSPYRYHSSFIGASVLAGTEAYEQSLLQRVDYDDGPGPAYWLV